MSFGLASGFPSCVIWLILTSFILIEGDLIQDTGSFAIDGDIEMNMCNQNPA